MNIKDIITAVVFAVAGMSARAQSIVRTNEPEENVSVNNGKLIVQKNGQVLIGVAPGDAAKAPEPYNLVVTRGILTEKLKVANSQDAANWADFVFDRNYRLMPLSEVAAYIKAKQHLPGIPSAEEVKRDGIDVAAMDARLLQKIEELTLYVLQQQKEIEELKKQVRK